MKKSAKAKNLLLSIERLRDLNPAALRRATGGLCPVTKGVGDGGNTCEASGGVPDPASACPNHSGRCVNSNGAA